MPGHPAIMKGTVKSAFGAADEGVFSFDLHKYGNIDNTGGIALTGDADPGDTDGEWCPMAGPVFNPLAEFIWWDRVLNPFADPSRGTIADVTNVAADRDDDGNLVWTQSKLLHNLAGKNSIIGKSIKMKLTQDGDDVRACCVIG